MDKDGCRGGPVNGLRVNYHGYLAGVRPRNSSGLQKAINTHCRGISHDGYVGIRVHPTMP